MAIKRRSKNEDDEDDEERPRGKSRNDDDDEDDEPRRRRSRDEEEDDDDDRPGKSRKSRDEDDTPPPKGRKSKSKDDTPLPGRRKSRDDDKNDDTPPTKPQPAPVDDLDELDELEEEDKEKSYEEQLREYNKKKALKRKQLIALSDGLMIFAKQIQFFMLGIGVTAAASAGFFLLANLLYKDLLPMFMTPPGIMAIVLVVLIPVLGLSAARKSKEGPPKSDPYGMLTAILTTSIIGFSLALFPLTAWLNFVLESIYLRNLGRFLKDKAQVKAAQAVLMQHFLVGIGGPVVCGFATFFLMKMDTLGYILAGVAWAVWVLLEIKIFTEMIGVVRGLYNTLARMLKAEDKPEW